MINRDAGPSVPPHSKPINTPAILMLAYTHYENDPRVIRAAESALEGGFSVDVIALRRPDQLPSEIIRGVKVYRVQKRYRGGSVARYAWEYAKFFVRCTMMSARFLLTRRYNVIHVHNMPDALVFAALIPKLFGSKIILDIHDPMPETYGSKFRTLAHSAVYRFLLLQEKLSVAFADQMITVSEPVKDGILIKRGYRSERIGVIANFADDAIFRPQELPDLRSGVRFVFHGTILERYGLRTLIEAIAQVRNRSRMKVRIIGEGDFSAALHGLIQTHSVGDVVEFANRVYPLHEIPKVLSDCHVGLVPLDIERSAVANFALPLKLVEYTCLGLPSISIRNAAIEYYFGPDDCMFFDSGDAAELARAMDTVLENPGLLADFRKRLEDVRMRLLWSKEKTRYISLLRALAA